MREQDRGDFYEALKAAFDVYGKSIGSGAMSVYFDALADYELSSITLGLTRHLRDPSAGQFAPKPADIIRNIEGRSDDAAMLAWVKVRKSMGAVGAWNSIAFDDPIIHAVLIDLGGWPKMCSTLTNDLPFLAKDFERRYSAYKSRHAIPTECPRYLVGLSEGANSEKGYQTDPPVLVGDKNNAMLVLEGAYEKTLEKNLPFASAMRELQQKQKMEAA